MMLAVIASSSLPAQNSTPQVIRVQGFLSDSIGGSSVPANGTYVMTFTLYDAEFGGMPLAAVGPLSVAATNGLYSMDLSFSVSEFGASDRWIEVGVAGEVLSPRLRLVSTPYAYAAERLDGADASELEESSEIVSAQSVLQDQIDALSTQVATAGNTLDEAYDEGGPGAGRTINADAGSVKILGTGGLDVHGEVSLGEGGVTGAEMVMNAGVPGEGFPYAGQQHNQFIIKNRRSASGASDAQFSIGYAQSARSIQFGTASNSDFTSAVFVPHLIVKNNGWVTAPLLFGGANSRSHLTEDSNGGVLHILDNTPARNAYVSAFMEPGLLGKIEVRDGNNREAQIFGNAQIRLVDNGVTKIDLNGINGTTTTKVLQITGGSDIAEPMPVADGVALVAGSVLVIDEGNPGQLRLSHRSYDRRVAGVLSGAGGVRPGLTLGPSEVLGDGPLVALSGRVFCRATTSNGPIRPGDMLTTSDSPGLGMKATSKKRSRGAVIGKAMSALNDGEGLVLVLIQPQ